MNALTITELSGDLQFYQQGRVPDVPVTDVPVADADDVALSDGRPGHETTGEE